MTKQEMITYYLTYSDAYEDHPFGEKWAVMRRRENRKPFVFVYERGGHPCINLKCEPVSADFLCSAFSSAVSAYRMNKVYWNTVLLDSEVPWDGLQQTVHQSYELTRPKQRRGR